MSSAWDQLFGHAEQRQLFARSLQRGRLSHAYVFCGADGIGKYKFARLLAQSLFCSNRAEGEIDACGECRACHGFEAGTWPDFHEVSLPQGKSEIPVALLLGERDRRGQEGLCHDMSLSPMASNRRVAIIRDAEYLNEEGANAFLKTLEEPPPNTLILIICDSVDSLLATIRSRSQIVRFFPLTDAEVAAILLREKLIDNEQDAADVAAMSEGSLSVACQLLNPDLRRLKERIQLQLDQLDRMQPLDLSKFVQEELTRISTGADEQRRNADWLLRFLSEALNQRLRRLASGDFTDPLLQRLGVRSGVDLLSPALDRIITASQQIERNSPVPLVMESLFDDLARQFRSGPVSAR